MDRPIILVMGPDMAGSAGRCAHLTSAGWRTVHVQDAIEALAATRSNDVDLAVLQLPVDDTMAMDLPNVLRAISPAPYLPVVILADDPAESQRCQFLQSGADDVLSDDISTAELIARIRSLLRFKELHDQLADSQSELRAALERERKLMARLKADNASLQLLATTDPLTRAQNVRSFQAILEHEFKMAKRYNHPLALIMLDVDHFKVVNDTYGHPSGDYVLKELTVILKSAVRDSDVVCRTGGEEFSLILPRADHVHAADFAQRVRESVAGHVFNVYGQNINVTISLGAAVFPRDAEITEHGMLVYFSDQALLRAKESGRNRVVSFRDMDANTRLRLCRQYKESRQDRAGREAVRSTAGKIAGEPHSHIAT